MVVGATSGLGNAVARMCGALGSKVIMAQRGLSNRGCHAEAHRMASNLRLPGQKTPFLSSLPFAFYGPAPRAPPSWLSFPASSPFPSLRVCTNLHVPAHSPPQSGPGQRGSDSPGFVEGDTFICQHLDLANFSSIPLAVEQVRHPKLLTLPMQA